MYLYSLLQCIQLLFFHSLSSKQLNAIRMQINASCLQRPVTNIKLFSNQGKLMTNNKE